MKISDWQAVKTSSASSLPALFGGQKIRMRQEVRAGQLGGNYPMLFGTAEGRDTPIMPVDDFEGTQVIVVSLKDGLVINGVQYVSADDVLECSETDGTDLIVAGQYMNATTIEWGTGNFRLYYMKIYGIDGNLMMDLQPAFNNNQGCLIDRITNKYYQAIYNPWYYLEDIEPIPLDVNLINYEALYRGVTIDQYGNVSGHGPSCISSFILIDPSQTYEYKSVSEGWNKVNFYDDDLNWISGLSKGFGSGTFTMKPSEIPESARYVRMLGLQATMDQNHFMRIE